MDAQLLEILACPDEHHAPLTHDAVAQTLTCTDCARIFPIRDGIPVLLLDEALPPGAPAGAPSAAAPTDDTLSGGAPQSPSGQAPQTLSGGVPQPGTEGDQ